MIDGSKPLPARQAGSKVDPRYKSTTLESPLFPEDEALNREFAKARPRAKPEDNFAVSTGGVGNSRGGRDGKPGDPGMRQDSISTYHPSWGERIGDAAGRFAMSLGADRHGYQDVSRKIRDIVDVVPGLGTAVAGDDCPGRSAWRLCRRGDRGCDGCREPCSRWQGISLERP